MKTGSLIKELRIKKGLTQEELAGRTELSTRTIQRIENGEVDPRAYSLQMIAKALEVDYSVFVEEDPGLEQEKDDKLYLSLLHLSGMFLLFFPTFIIWSMKKSKVQGINVHFFDVLSFQLTMWLISVIPGVAFHFFFRMNNLPNRAIYMVIVGLALSIFFSISNAINILNNKPYKRFSFFKTKKHDNI